MVKTELKNLAKKLLWPFLIVVVGLGICVALIFTKPSAKKQDKEENAPLVSVMVIEKANTPITIKAQGQMEPAHVIRVLAEVSGKIIWTHPQFSNGGMIKKDEVLVKIDPKEYELALVQKKSVLASAKLNLSLETAHQEVASDEFLRRSNAHELTEEAKTLATRAQHLDKAKAEYAAAVAEVKKAELALLKTTIRAPINAMIHRANTHTGELIFAPGEVAVLYGTDEFKAEVNIPIHELTHLKFADTGSKVGSKAIVSQLSMNDTVIEREGVVSKLLPEMGSLGHMARVVVVVQDPLGVTKQKALPLLAKAKVEVRIMGSELTNALMIPRAALTQDDAILIVDNESKIVRFNPTIIRRDKDVVYVTDEALLGARVVLTKGLIGKIGHKVRLSDQQ